MPNPATDLFHQATELLLAKDMTGFIALFADDGVMEFPFASGGQPSRVAGRAALHDYLIDYPQTWTSARYTTSPCTRPPTRR
jgi:ketosteroid isomerase-like protein